MADLLDIAPSTAVDSVWIDGNRIVVRGLKLKAIAAIVARFPELRTLLNGFDNESAIGAMIVGCAASVGPVIAAGCGHLGDKVYEEFATDMTLDSQAKILKPIFALTFPNGVGSFIQNLTALLGDDEGAKKKKPIKMRSRKSPSVLPPSSDGASPQPLS
jgi:hypothetical protein